MKYSKIFLYGLFFFLIFQSGYAQDGKGQFSGNLASNVNFFMRDTAIGASDQPQYDHQFVGSESWLNLNYSNWGFDVGLRFDLYNNSNALNPRGSDNVQGIGRWFIKKRVQKLHISVGHLYDQIGSGIIFRTYEERPLAIDNSLFGLRLKYNLSEDWVLKGMLGKQRRLVPPAISIYDPMVKALSLDGFYAGEGEGSNWSIAPGIGIVNRTLDDAYMTNWTSKVESTEGKGEIESRHNAFAVSAYNTLSAGNFSWYIEGAYKTAETLFIPPPDTVVVNSLEVEELIKGSGNIFYTTLSYAAKGLGATLEYKRTDNFRLRINHDVELNSGMLGFLPPVTRVNTYRLTARYNAATQDLGEQAFQADISYKVNKKLLLNVNFSNITTLENELLYREIYAEATYKYKRKWQLISGIQLQNYNEEVYLFKTDKGIIQTITPFAEFLYKFDRKKSLRVEAQYMNTNSQWAGKSFSQYKGNNRDYGDWVFLLAEVGLAPHWIFEVSDMYNLVPVSPAPGKAAKALHYPTLGIVYTKKSNRFSLRYVKQVEGVVCTGGICRLEPAFSGVKFTLNSTF